jgi:DUF2993 family protein
MGSGRRRSIRIALGLAGGVVVVLGLAQLLLPKLAAQRVRSELARYGVVRSVAVSAFPAVELLWGHAQSANVSAGNIDMSPAEANQLMGRARGVQRMDIHATSMHLGSLGLNDVDLRKRADSIYIDGLLSDADLRAMLPGSTGFELLSSSSGGATIRVKGNLFGVTAALNVQLSAVEGKLVAQPQGSLFAGLVKVTLLSVPNIDVRSIAVADAPSTEVADPAYRVSVTAELR